MHLWLTARGTEITNSTPRSTRKFIYYHDTKAPMVQSIDPEANKTSAEPDYAIVDNFLQELSEFERMVEILNNKSDEFDERISLTEPFPPLETFFTEEELGPDLFQRVFGALPFTEKPAPSTLFVKPEGLNTRPSGQPVAPSSPPEIFDFRSQNTPSGSSLSSPEASIASAPVPSVQAGEPVSPELLGDNPIEVARNMELAQRTRRGA